MNGKQNIGNKEAVKEAVKLTESPLYWVIVAVKQGQISAVQAGHIIKELGL